MQQKHLAVAKNQCLSFRLTMIGNEPLEIGVWNFVK
jgi:hypothetical protein